MSLNPQRNRICEILHLTERPVCPVLPGSVPWGDLRIGDPLRATVVSQSARPVPADHSLPENQGTLQPPYRPGCRHRPLRRARGRALSGARFPGAAWLFPHPPRARAYCTSRAPAFPRWGVRMCTDLECFPPTFEGCHHRTNRRATWETRVPCYPRAKASHSVAWTVGEAWLYESICDGLVTPCTSSKTVGGLAVDGLKRPLPGWRVESTKARAKPVVWTGNADQIPASRRCFCMRTSNPGHWRRSVTFRQAKAIAIPI